MDKLLALVRGPMIMGSQALQATTEEQCVTKNKIRQIKTNKRVTPKVAKPDPTLIANKSRDLTIRI